MTNPYYEYLKNEIALDCADETEAPADHTPLEPVCTDHLDQTYFRKNIKTKVGRMDVTTHAEVIARAAIAQWTEHGYTPSDLASDTHEHDIFNAVSEDAWHLYREAECAAPWQDVEDALRELVK